MLMFETRSTHTSSTMNSQKAAALIAALAQCAVPLSSSSALALPQFAISYQRVASSDAPGLTVRDIVDADEQLAADLHSLFKRIAEAQTDVEDVFLPALYEKRTDFYKLL